VWNFQPQPDAVIAPGWFDLYSERFHPNCSPHQTTPGDRVELRRCREAPDDPYAVVIAARTLLVEIDTRSRKLAPEILTARRSDRNAGVRPARRSCRPRSGDAARPR
jgi:hypothetical protein